VKRIYEVSQYDVSKVIQKTIEFGKQVGQKIQEGTKKAVNFIKSLF
jgi:hypothetical protein